MSRSPWIGRSLVDTFDQNYVLDEQSGCWNWQRHLNQHGYGKVTRNGKKIGAHRYSLERVYRIDPDSRAVVRHTCDNPRCVNPDHLAVGTQADNIADMVKRGRNRSALGEDCHLAKLNERDVLEIRKRAAKGEKMAHIARTYPVSPKQVGNIVRRKVWRHVP